MRDRERELAEALARYLDGDEEAEAGVEDKGLLALAQSLEDGAVEGDEELSRRRVWNRVAAETVRGQAARQPRRWWPAPPVAIGGAAALRWWLAPPAVVAGVMAAAVVAVLLTMNGGGPTPVAAGEALIVQAEGGPPTITSTGGGPGIFEVGEALPVEPDSFGHLFLQWTKDGETLAYVFGSDIWAMTADGQKMNLTDTLERVEGLPRWSSGGDRLAFASRARQPGEEPNALVGPSGSLTLIDADGSGYEVVGEGDMIWPPSWSPDGRLVVYSVSGVVGVFDTESGEAATYSPVDLGLPEAKYFDAAAWSPTRDELLVYFSTSAAEPTREDLIAGTAPRVRQGFAVVQPGGGAASVVFEYEAPFLPAGPAQWSPDGDHIVIGLNPSPIFANPAGLWIVDRTGQQLREVDGVIPYQALWSPSGEQIAYIDNEQRRVIVLDSLTLDVAAEPGPGSGVEGIAWRPSREG